MDVPRLQSEKLLSDIVLSRNSSAGNNVLKCATRCEIEICANCGAQFHCRPGNCWCDAVCVPREALAEMQLSFDRCLCPNCLKAVADKYSLTRA
jgi:Cysteine-rich CWC